MEICRLENISKTYSKGENVCPLKDISLSINSKDFISIEGPSGIGKSTLLYIIGGLLKADTGKIFIQDIDVSTLNDKSLTTLRGEKIGFIFQEPNLINSLTLEENLEISLLVSTGKKDKKKVNDILERLGLDNRKNFLPHKLSGGQKRRAAIARGIIHNPSLILADEPTNDLDENYAKVVMDILGDLSCKGSAVVMVTHNTKWMDKVNTRYEINNGYLNKK